MCISAVRFMGMWQNWVSNAYGSCEGGIEFARKVFDKMLEKRNPVCWSALIGGYVCQGRSGEAVDLFRRMQVDGVLPDEVTIVTVLSACDDLGALELGKWIDMYMEHNSIPRSIEVSNSLMGMRERTIVTWTAIIDGMAMYGHGSDALHLFLEMQRWGILPDDVIFIGLLSACSHVGLIEEGCRHFESMVREFGITPKIEHYGCMVDLFSRAGLVEKAFEFVMKMPMKPNTIICCTSYEHYLAHVESTGSLH